MPPVLGGIPGPPHRVVSPLNFGLFHDTQLCHKRKRDTIEFVLDAGWKTLMGDAPAPPLEELLHYLDFSHEYSDGAAWSSKTSTPGAWWALFGDRPLATFGRLVSSMPCTARAVSDSFQTDVFRFLSERVVQSKK
jgi:hypothetical protein